MSDLPYQPAQPCDADFMQQALTQAETARYRTSPNPRVGCVLVKDGVVIGRGATLAVGGDHAEVQALKNAFAQGHSAQGATAYVTLEPCNHTGRTGPCSDALLQAGITRVVAAITDPNPATAGAGLKKLAAAGVSVTLGVGAAQAAQQNIGFIKRMLTGLPWVRLKTAASLDGYIALPNGQSQWLTGEDARKDTHHWRASSCAVLTGIGTVLADNPRMDVRHVSTPRQPLRVVLDTQLRTPPDAALFAKLTPFDAPVLIVHACSDTRRQSALQAVGAQLLAVPIKTGQLDLAAMLQHLGARGINELHLECGSRLNTAFMAAGLVDEVMLYQAPMLLGAGLPWMHSSTQFTHLDQIPRLRLQDAQVFGDDVRVRLHTAHTFAYQHHT